MTNQISTEFEEVRLIYRNKTKASDRPMVNCPEKAYSILRKSWDMEQINLLEEGKILLLDGQLRLMSIASISKGAVDSVEFDPRIIFSIALKRRSHRIILAHNHPSGSLEPSAQDLTLTNQFIEAGRVLSISIDDHIIITEEGYCSLRMDYGQELFKETNGLY